MIHAASQDVPLGVPAGGFDLQHVPPRALNGSYAEIVVEDKVDEFMAECFERHILPAVMSAGSETITAEFPSPDQIRDRIKAAVMSQVRKEVSDERIAATGPQVLERLQRQESPYDEWPKLIAENFAAIREAIELYTEGLKRHPIKVVQDVIRELRRFSDDLVLQTPLSIERDVERLQALCRFTHEVESGDDLVPPISRSTMLKELRRLIFERLTQLAGAIIDDVLRKSIVAIRKSCLDAADRFEAHVRHRIGRLQGIGGQLREKADRNRKLAARRSKEQTVFAPAIAGAELMDRLGLQLGASSESEIGEIVVQKFEAELNLRSRQAGQIEDPLPLEELLGRIGEQDATLVLASVLRRHLQQQDSIYQAIASDVVGLTEALASKAMPTMEFAGRNKRCFGVESTRTAYVALPEADTPFERTQKERVLNILRKHFSRIETSSNVDGGMITVLCHLGPIVPGTQAGLLACHDAFLVIADPQNPQHDPRLLGPAFERVPNYESIRQYRTPAREDV